MLRRVVTTSLLSLIWSASTIAAQERVLLTSTDRTRTFLELDSVPLRGNVQPYRVVITDTMGVPMTEALRYEMDCGLFRYRYMDGQEWSEWHHMQNVVPFGAHENVCVYPPGRWLYMFANDGDEYAVDRQTIDSIADPKGSRVWIKILKDRTTQSREASEMMRYDFACEARQLRTLTMVQYDSTGSVLASREVQPDSAAWSAAIPESIGERMQQWICESLPIARSYLARRGWWED